MITAIILAKNEEKNIIDCLDSVTFCDEVIVVDDESQDKTSEIARKSGAQVVKKSLKRNFSKQRNYALSLAKNEWVLFVDADERVSKDLAEEIQNKITNSGTDGYFVKRDDEIFGKVIKHGELQNKKFLRLGRRDKGKWNGTVHEIWDINGNIGVLSNPLIHIPHQTISEFISEVNFYTTLRAEELYKKGTRSNWFLIIFYTKAKFVQTYVLKLGFLDGISGFILSLIMSLHTFLVRGKLWLLQKNKLKE